MTTYWISDICALFTSFDINPLNSDDKNSNFNALTRLIILLTVLFCFMNKENYDNIILAGGISIILTILIYFSTYNNQETLMFTQYYKKENYESEEDEQVPEIINNYVHNSNNYSSNIQNLELNSPRGLNNFNAKKFF